MATSDRRFVASSWATSYRDSYSAGIVSNETWHSVMWAELNAILDRPDIRTIVAYEPGAAAAAARSDILGCIVGSGEARYVAYVYVKEAARRAGVARWLFEQLGVDPSQPFEYACKTPASIALEEKIPRAKWNPVPLRAGSALGGRTAKDRSR